MSKDKAITLESLRVMDAIDRRGSFAAAADELNRVPSALSYTMAEIRRRFWMLCYLTVQDIELNLLMWEECYLKEGVFFLKLQIN
ncbi:LysR-family transcriptional regulator [Proteus mirabilis]|uniref:LysR-family transcriptional regulator n=1 Tax=Proteus mirabilis TaxID=584 RepID=A0A2X2DJM1_PROMI|nr:LysR-family transcriptional regulator [Proteus mirabilis]